MEHGTRQTGMFRYFVGDLHVHTVLSACAEREMLPSAVLERAQELGLQMLAVTDHNSAENVAALWEAAQGTEITILPGMEVQTREEVHLICLFDTVDQALALQETVYTHLPNQKNDERFFGPQWIVNACDEVVAHNNRLLAVACNLSVTEAVNRVNGLGGLCIPAHVDRPAYSILSQLGFIPPDLDLIAVEISHLITPKQARERFPQLRGYSLVANSDAHYLRDMDRRNTFKIQAPTIAEIKLALAFRDGKEMWIDGQRP